MLPFVFIGVVLFHRTSSLSDCEFENWRNGMGGSDGKSARKDSISPLVDEFFPCAVLRLDRNCEGGALNTGVNAAVADLSQTDTTVRATIKCFDWRLSGGEIRCA